MAEKVNHPNHYQGKIEVIDYIEEYSKNYPEALTFNFGNVIKYVSRAPRKNGKEDLEKARWYLDRMIEKWDECQNRDVSMVDLVINENKEAVNEWIGAAAEEINADRKILTNFTEIVNVTSDLNADLPYKCARCCSDLWDFTKYCPHCGRLNVNFKEEN